MASPTRFCFVDIDTQVDFISPAGKLYVPGAEEIVPNLRRLTELALRLSIPIVSSVDAHTPDDPEFALWPPHCVAGTPGQQKIPETLVGRRRTAANDGGEALPFAAQQIVVEKQTYNMFDNPKAAAIFAGLRPDICVVYGVATDVCVLIEARELCRRGYAVWLATDAIEGIDAEKAEAALKELTAAGARLVTTEQAAIGVARALGGTGI